MASFDQISVISDLHLGGPSDFRIFHQGPLLGAFVDHVRQSAVSNCALVMNGDSFDFLAEPGARCFDPEGATGKLDRIIADPGFAPVFDALREFVKTPGRHLVITLGNHDLELALPWVQAHLRQTLAGAETDAASRVAFACDGAGFACRVANSSVLCVHGNEVDTWNVVDYEAMRRLSRDLVQGRPIEDWTPNAGSKLVIEVMNEIKREYAFIDLLKPEQEGAVRILMIIRPDKLAKFREIAAVASRRAWDAIRRGMGWLSVESEAGGPQAVRDPLARVAAARQAIDAQALLDRTEVTFRTGKDPLDMVSEQEALQLGWWDALVSMVRQREPHEVAWEAIKEISGDTSFDVRRVDPDFERIDQLAGPGFDFVIAGHTHFARVLGRAKGGGLYLNTGTWVTFMRLTPAQLASPRAFRPVFEKLCNAKTVADLGNLVSHRPTAVTIRNRNGKTEAALELVTMDKGKLKVTPL